jgi:glycosyltransferase involved in cell wall biosynthesis
MSFGKPTIGTGYGGNTQFMNADNSYVIPYALTEIGKGAGPYPADAHWAEPDVNAAAAAMRRVFDNREEAAQIGERGRQWLGEHFTVERAGEFVERRFAELHADPAELAAAEPAT